MRIAFYYDAPGDWGWRGADLEGRGLGGTETALILLVRHLARHAAVTVFCGVGRPEVHRGVCYRPRGSLGKGEGWDAFVGMRGPVECLPGVRSRVKLFWSCEEDAVLVGDWEHLLPHLRAVVTLSPYHTAQLARRSGLSPALLWEIPLGVNLSDYRAGPRRDPAKLLYCSVPGRGAEHLGPILEEIQRRCAAAHLVVTSDFSLWGRPPGDEEHRRRLAGLPGVEYLGKVSRSRLVREQMTAAMHLYPCTVPELFCLAALECQAAGAPTVATRLGALTTTVADGATGILLPGWPGEGDFTLRMAGAVADLLADPPRLARLSRQARRRARGFSYHRTARRWLARIAAAGGA